MSRTGLNVEFVSADAFNRSDVNALYSRSANKIYINAEANSKTFDELIVHETSHALYTNAKIRKIINKMAKNLTSEERREIRKTYSESLKGKTLSQRAEIMSDEFGAHYLEYMLNREGMLNALLSEDGSISQNLASVINKTSEAYKNDKHLAPATKRVFKAFKKALNEYSATNKHMNAYKELVKNNEDGERYSLPIGGKIVDARSVTEQDVRTLLDNAFNKQYKDGSYIPVRVNTPSILIEAAQSLGKSIDNFPIILNVGKARQMMSSRRDWAIEQKGGTAHDFAVDDVISLIKAMDNPKQIIYQSINERYVEVVEFKTAENQKAVAVLEIGENKNPEYLNGYNGGFYQVLVTAFEPDTGYVESLLNKDGNIQIYPKKKGSSQRGSGNQVPSHLNDSPFAISISQSPEKINPSDKISSKISVEDGRASISKKIVDTYTKEQYNSFGWVRQNDVINSGYWKSFTENFAQAVTGLQNYPLTSNGEFMIEAYDYYNQNSVADVIVYASGTIENPIVSKIVKLNPSIITEIDKKRRLLYEAERRGVQPKTEGIFDVYHRADFSSKLRSSGNRTPSNSYNNRSDTKRSRSEIKVNPITQFYVDEERNTITFFYANGTQTTERLDSPKGINDGRASLSTPSSITGQTPSFVDPAAKSVTLQSSEYKSTIKERASDSGVAAQIAFTNAQAGVERLMRDVGISQPDAEAMVQYTRLASAQANNIIGGSFVDISGNTNTLVKKGKRLRGCQIKN